MCLSENCALTSQGERRERCGLCQVESLPSCPPSILLPHLVVELAEEKHQLGLTSSFLLYPSASCQLESGLNSVQSEEKVYIPPYSSLWLHMVIVLDLCARVKHAEHTPHHASVQSTCHATPPTLEALLDTCFPAAEFLPDFEPVDAVFWSFAADI